MAIRGDEMAARAADNGPAFAWQGFKYDADSDLKNISTHYGVIGQSALQAFNFGFNQDGSGKMTVQQTANDNWSFTPQHDANMDYGSANKLDQYGSLYGNLYMGGAEQVTNPPANDTSVFTFDSNGNLTSDGTGRSYEYNSENQLIRAVSTVPGAGFDISYLYDTLGRRSYTKDGASETFHKHWGQMEVGDYGVTRDAAGKVTLLTTLSRVIPGAGIDERLAALACR